MADEDTYAIRGEDVWRVARRRPAVGRHPEVQWCPFCGRSYQVPRANCPGCAATLKTQAEIDAITEAEATGETPETPETPAGPAKEPEQVQADTGRYKRARTYTVAELAEIADSGQATREELLALVADEQNDKNRKGAIEALKEALDIFVKQEGLAT